VPLHVAAAVVLGAAARRLRIRVATTLLLFRDREAVEGVTGMQSERDLAALIEKRLAAPANPPASEG
jgi:hypothetical protein